jgi:hypothetical protein
LLLRNQAFSIHHLLAILNNKTRCQAQISDYLASSLKIVGSCIQTSRHLLNKASNPLYLLAADYSSGDVGP